jgi:hypothetical protein
MPYKPTGQAPGRPKKVVEIKPETVIAAMAEKQCSKTEIAALLGISTDTFDRRYAVLYTTCREGGKAKLREKLFQVAMLGNTQVLIFLAKTQLGMKEVSGLEVTGADGEPLHARPESVSAVLSDPAIARAAGDLAIAMALRSSRHGGDAVKRAVDPGAASPSTE